MQFDVEVYRNEHAVTVNGRTEQEALTRLLEALGQHFKRKPQGSGHA